MTTATKADRERFQALQDSGCVVCGEFHGHYQPPDIHHLVDGYRLGHQFTIPLCEWHHRGVPKAFMSCSETEKELGPSLARSKIDFNISFGTERELLDRTNALIGVTA